MSPELRARISETLKRKGIRPPSRKGKTPWNKGLKGVMPVAWNKGLKGVGGRPKGIKISEEHKRKISEGHLRKNGGFYKRQDKRNDSAYIYWQKQVKKRDKVCRLRNEECTGYLVAHHIKSWRDYIELRYELTNGITLCLAHHPLRRAEEKRLVPVFQGLVSVSKV